MKAGKPGGLEAGRNTHGAEGRVQGAWGRAYRAMKVIGSEIKKIRKSEVEKIRD